MIESQAKSVEILTFLYYFKQNLFIPFEISEGGIPHKGRDSACGAKMLKQFLENKKKT